MRRLREENICIATATVEAAVAAGALTPEAATALRNYVAGARTTPAVDEEHFRLLTGFNDIFVRSPR
jgi:hypothetical protein